MTRAVVLVLAVVLASPARADSNEAQAKALYDEGKAAFAAGDYPTACDKLEASFELNPLSGTRGLLAGCYEKVGKLASAWNAYRDSAAIAQRQNNLERAQIALEKARELEPRLARLTIDATALAPVAGAEVVLDGVVQPTEALRSAIPVDEGPHVIEARARDHKPWKQSIEIRDGEKQSVQVPRLVEDPTARLAAEARLESQRRRARNHRWLGLGLAGAGGVALVAGTTFGLWARSQWSDARDAGCSDAGACPPGAASTAESARLKADIATGCFIGGLALAAAGTIVYLTAPSAKPSDETRPQVTPAVGPNALGVVVRGRF